MAEPLRQQGPRRVAVIPPAGTVMGHPVPTEHLNTATLSAVQQLTSVLDTIRVTCGMRYAEDHARGREAVENAPRSLDHTRGASAQAIAVRETRLAYYTTQLIAAISQAEDGSGADIRRLTDYIIGILRDIAYWDGIRYAARFLGVPVS